MSNQRAPAGQHQKKITPTAPWGPAAGDMQLADQHDQVGRIIRATNVHNQASNGDLATFFNEFEVIDVKRSYMSRVDKSKASPIAWLLLSSPEEARTAKYRLHDVPLHGRPVRIELAEALRGTNVLIPRGKFLDLTWSKKEGIANVYAKSIATSSL